MLICSLYVWGCAEPQRDFYQAPPAQPAGLATTATEAQLNSSSIVRALDREGYDFSPVHVVADLVHGEIGRDGAAIGRIIVVQYDPDSADQRAVEARIGAMGSPARERQLALAVADQLAQEAAGPGRDAEPRPAWSMAPLTGRWIDLEAAVGEARLTRQEVDLAVISVDRWRYATLFEMRTLSGDSADLIVIGDRESASGPRRAYVRIGLFGDPERQSAFLNRLRASLAELGRIERLPGAR